MTIQDVILDTDSIAYAQSVQTLTIHSVVISIIQSHPYAIAFLLILGPLFNFVTHHRATNHTCRCGDILPGTTADLMAEYATYDTADNGTSPYAGTLTVCLSLTVSSSGPILACCVSFV